MTIVPDMLILYVDDVARSADFYADLSGRKPVEQSTGFALFLLDAGLKLGLWKRSEVEPTAKLTGGGGELAVTVEEISEVDRLAAAWRAKGIEIAQETVEMDFGYTFVALDPDNHRVRVFCPSQRG